MSAFDPASLGLRAATPAQAAEPRESFGEADFLTLLITQLKNQDPLSPMDNEAFVAQLAQFSTVSGINSSNEKLDRLAQLAGADARSTAPQWIGRTVEGADGASGKVASVSIAADSALTLMLEDGRTLRPAEQLQSLADALPALGIVAAVLGVVKTMGSIDQPPSVLGGMIGSALVGTFLGVLLAYGMVGPMATRLKSILEADAEIYQVVRRVILSSLRNQPQPIVLETARTAIRPANQPAFTEVFEGLRGK